MIIKLHLLGTAAVALDDIGHDTRCKGIGMILRTLIALIGSRFKNWHFVLLLDLARQLRNMSMVSRAVGHLESGYQVALGINGHLRIVTHAEAFVGLHQARVWIGKRYLLITALLQQLSITLIALFALLALFKLMLQFLLRQFTTLFGIVFIKLPQVAVDVLVKSGYTVIQLVQREVPVLGVDSLELAAVNRDKTLGEQVLAKAETVEFPECLLNGLLVVLAEVGYRAEVRSKLTQKPHHLDVYQALTGKLAR